MSALPAMAPIKDVARCERTLPPMKKVRYTAGVLGALGMLPAAGMTAPATAAVTAHPQITAGKSVRLDHRVVRVNCAANHKHTSTTSIRGYISYNPASGCVAQVIGHRYHGHATGEQMRIRYYNLNTLIHSSFVNGFISSANNSISFPWGSPGTVLATSMSNVCERIVEKAPPHQPVTGAVCQSTGFRG